MQCLSPMTLHFTLLPRIILEDIQDGKVRNLKSNSLKKDVAEQKHLVYKPKVLRESFDEYKKFPLDVFRDHIYQEEGKLVKSSYWLSRKKKREKKNENTE